MAIHFDEQKRLIHLQGKTVSLCLHIDEQKNLLNLHWGARLEDGDVRYLLEGVHAGSSWDLYESRLPHDEPVRGGGYFQTPAVCAVNVRGDDIVRLSYVKHEIFKGKKALAGLPMVYAESEDEASTVVITMKDEMTGLVTEISYTLMEELDCITRSVNILNEGSEKLVLTHMQSASMPMYGSDYDVINLSGAWARERWVNRTPVAHASFRVESQRGASSHEQNPFIALCEKAATEHMGQVWAMALVYSGSFLASVDVNNFSNARMSIGLNPEVCRWNLLPGESFQTPEAVLVYSGEGFNGMSHIFHKTVRTRVVRGHWRDKLRPIVINNWEATHFDFNEESIERIASKAAYVGSELFVLDDGWFGKRNAGNSSLGDWVVNREKLPGGIKGICDKVNKMGMMFGLWFEPEMISPNSDLYRAHPDWCLHAKGRSRTEARNQLILDLSRPEIQDYIIEAVASVLRSANIAYVKWDMNRNMTEYYSCDREPDKQMETQHRYMLGVYRVMDALTSMFPEVLFEGCAGGGGRFDMGMLYYMPQFWTSDDTDPIERLKIQYGTSFVFPASTMGAHVSKSPNRQTGRVTPIEMRANVALGGNFGFELDLNLLSEEEIESVQKTVETVKALRETLQMGEFTRIESPFDGNYAVWQFISEDGNDVILCAYRRLTMPNPHMKKIFLKGLEADAVYTDTETGRTYSGSALMHCGIVFKTERGDYQSRIYTFRKN
ncbi:MAG: alpha-galactosidase [Clostridia bacterium]|nr:alpha-galactosidase [Clostridia bacterium]